MRLLYLALFNLHQCNPIKRHSGLFTSQVCLVDQLTRIGHMKDCCFRVGNAPLPIVAVTSVAVTPLAAVAGHKPISRCKTSRSNYFLPYRHMVRLKHKTTNVWSRLCAAVFLVTVFAVISPTAALADTQRPSIVNGINTTTISETRIRVTWNRPWDDNGIAGYNIYRNGSYYTTVRDTFLNDENVSAGTQYDYQISAFDWSENYSELSAVASVRSLGNTSVAPPAPQFDPGGSVDRPNPPLNVRSEVLNGNSIRLSWDEPASPAGVTKYNVFRDTAYLTTVNTNQYTESWIEWGRDYSYTVVAIDSSERFSDLSDAHVANTANPSGSNNTNNNANNNTGSIQNDAQNVATNNSSSVPEGYNLVFSEEFRGSSLDSSKWNSSYRWSPYLIINSEQQFYVDHLNNPSFGYNPFSFDGEHLNITAQRTPDYLRGNASGQPFLSGALTTYNKFRMRYGYIEIRARLPAGRGLWPAFWLLHQHDHDRRPEIDVVEMLGHQPNLVYNTFHWVENGSPRRSPSFEAWGPDYSQDFHTYAVRWEPGVLTWYVDGEQRNVFNNGNVSWEEMYLLVNLAVGGWWPGNPDQSTPFPATMSIDYIRAYQRQ